MESLSASLFPAICRGCGVRGEYCCPECARGLPWARPAPPPAGVDEWWAVFAYESVARELIVAAKYRSLRAATSWFASQIDTRVPRGLRAVVTWAPTTRRRRRERGFDHAEAIARSFARRRSLAFEDMLERVDVVAQTGRSASERRTAPPVFAVTASPRAPVMLVDDVATTGATIAAAAAALRRAGAPAVYAVTVARADTSRTRTRRI